MTDDTLQRLEAELADIDGRLAELAAMQRRREQLRTLIALWRQLYLGEGSSPTASVAHPVADERTLVKVSKDGSQKARILDASDEIITKHGPTGTRALIDRLAEVGVEVGGTDKVAVLSAVLSRSERFKSDRAAGGWVLNIQGKEEAPQGVDAPAGPSV